MTNCRFCNTPLTVTFTDLGTSPLSNAYVAKESISSEKYYPLHAYVCTNCLLVQVASFEDPDVIFSSDYAYYSSYSSSWLKHSEDYAKMIVKKFSLDNKSFVVEVASNDGYLLQFFQAQHIPHLGIEPTKNTADAALKKGIPTLREFFGKELANKLQTTDKSADLIVANNVLAHVPDLNDFIAGMKILLKASGIITIEFPHLLNLIQHNQFDTIYHEHFSYFSLATAQKIFAHHNLTIFDVDQIPTHGGSLRIYVRHTDDICKKVTTNIDAILAEEEKAGLTKLETYQQFQLKVEQLRAEFLSFLSDIQKKKGTIAGYGAPAKGNTFLNYCQITPSMLPFTVDKNPAKQNKYLPGTHIPIFHPGEIKKQKPNYVLILPWNLQEEITKELAYIKSWGGRFIVTSPKPKILS
ncbi:methyltransferase domain-containing protein [Candidatus Babeliales bacterium]|nr:methyltransferase domain-containing protein [Candidatus Babeliales bacterium]